jgi:hypothetical protein
MPAVTLVLETGAGLANSNSYASVADGDNYHGRRLYSDKWEDADPGDKEKALMMATMVIDQSVQFYGYQVKETQALLWPRTRVVNRQVYSFSFLSSTAWGVIAPYFDTNKIPPQIRDATCELARLLLTSDRTADDSAKGISSFEVAGELSVSFLSPADRKQVFTDQLKGMLEPFGKFRFKRGSVDIVRAQ